MLSRLPTKQETKLERSSFDFVTIILFFGSFLEGQTNKKMLSPPKPVRFSVAQQALVRLEKIRVQGAFIIVNTLLLLLVAYTAYRSPHKYVRVKGEYVACRYVRVEC